MSIATQRLIKVITKGDPIQTLSFNILLSYIEHLQRTKGASIDSIHTVLAVAYMNVPEGQRDTLNTHLAGAQKMTIQTLPVQAGVLTCDKCATTLHGYDAFFNVCNGCAQRILAEADQRWTFCKQYPSCGCRKPSECTEEAKA